MSVDELLCLCVTHYLSLDVMQDQSRSAGSNPQTPIGIATAYPPISPLLSQTPAGLRYFKKKIMLYSALNRSCNATVKAEVTRFITLTNQSRASILRCRPTRDQPCLIGQRITSALTVALQDLFKAL